MYSPSYAESIAFSHSSEEAAEAEPELREEAGFVDNGLDREGEQHADLDLDMEALQIQFAPDGEGGLNQGTDDAEEELVATSAAERHRPEGERKRTKACSRKQSCSPCARWGWSEAIW